MTLKMRTLSVALLILLSTNKSFSQAKEKLPHDVFMVGINVPVDYAKVTVGDLENYAKRTLGEVTTMMASIRAQKSPTFVNVFVTLDDISNLINTTSNNCNNASCRCNSSNRCI